MSKVKPASQDEQRQFWAMVFQTHRDSGLSIKQAGSFLRHQPQYQPDACQVVSGSSRTALGIIGFHCGITEVVIPDLSWSTSSVSRPLTLSR